MLLSARVQLERTQLSIFATIHNRNGDILLLNRLWSLDARNQVAFGAPPAYVFFHEGRLRVLLGACPLPMLQSVAYRNLPYATLVKAGTTSESKIILPRPIKEYSAYFSFEQGTIRTVRAIDLIVQWVPADKLPLRPSPLDPSAIQLPAVALDNAQYARLLVEIPPVEIAVAAGKFERFALPEEEPEMLPDE